MIGGKGRRRWLRWPRWGMKPVVVAAMVGTLVSGVVCHRVHQHQRYWHFAVHDPGKVYRSGWLRSDVFEELVKKHKIRTVINLCDANEKCGRVNLQRKAVERGGARLVELVYPANNTWDTDYEVIRETEALFDDPANYPLWIHCYHGRERTVKALTIYDVRKRGLTAEVSLKRMPLWGRAHTWPIVVFAHQYQDESLRRHDAAHIAGGDVDPATRTAAGDGTTTRK